MDPKLKVIMIGIGIIILILVSGCVERTQQNDSVNKSLSYLFFPTQKESVTSYMDALFVSSVQIDNNGCLRAGEYLLVWPYNFSLRIDNKTIQIISDKGKPIARIGDKIKVGGGECGGCTNEDIAKISAQLPSDRCPGPYWIASLDIRIIHDLE